MKYYCKGRSAINICYRTTMVAMMYFLASCNVVKVKGDSYWKSQRENFKYSNLKNFVSDSILKENLKSCYKVKHKSIDSVVSSDGVYLYSWQNRDTLTNEFTVIEDDGERGLDICYVIMDKNDNLLSVTEIAGKGLESGITYEIRSRFISRDSIVQIQSITQTWDMVNRKKMDKFVGDSTFLYLTIDKQEKFGETIFKEVKELNYSDK